MQHVPGEAMHAKNNDMIEEAHEAHASSSEAATEYVDRIYSIQYICTKVSGFIHT